MRLLALLLLLIPLTVHAQNPRDDWRDEASPYDIERIESRGRALEMALEAAFRNGAPEDIAKVRAITGPAMPIEGEALLGDWRCRTIKLGGNYVPLIVYGWFQCRIRLAEDGLWFEKVSGSQQTSGYLRPVYPEGGGLPTHYVYLGVAHYADEPEGVYPGPPNQLRRVAENRNDAGVLEALEPTHLRIGFPLPVFESEYDFLELRR